MTIALIETTRDRFPPDAELAHAAGSGDAAAFEALYERHHRALLSFARHMLGRVHDAEDVVQHTFVAADAAFRRGDVPVSVRAWLFTVARNRCVSILRERRDDRGLPDADVPSAENLAYEVELRDDLRALLVDLRMLPEDQRAALLLAELGELSHAEVARVLGVRPRKIKALVYQARQALLAAAGARAIPCRSIREELAVATGSARRRRHLRDHVARCDACRAYADGVSRQRASLAAILPVVPTVALRDSVLACLGSGSVSAAAGAGASAGIGVAGAKLLAVVAIGGAAAGGGAVAITSPDKPRDTPPAARAAKPALPQPAPAAPVSAVRDPAVPVSSVPVAAHTPARSAPRRTPARSTPPRRAERRDAAERRGRKPPAPPGLAVAEARQQARAERPPKVKPDKPAPARSNPSGGPPGAQPAREKPQPPRPAPKTEPAVVTLPPGQATKPEEPRGQLKEK
jgi:RNA polymerase sigma factor (sigma-70 family)